MKKMMSVLALLFLLTSCAPEPEIEPAESGCNLPYRVWESWEEMKEVLGDHYLYPTYLPEAAKQSRISNQRSWFNSNNRELSADELFFGYVARFWNGNTMDDFIEITATDYGKMNPMNRHRHVPRSLNFPAVLENPERFNEHTVTIGGADIEFFTLYGTLPPPEGTTDLEQWHTYHARNARIVYYTFTIDTVTYFMQWSQYNVEDKYADDEQREGMLRVARSIIEQVMEVE